MISSSDSCFDKHTLVDWNVAVDPFIACAMTLASFAPAWCEFKFPVEPPPPPPPFPPVTEHSNGIVSVQPGDFVISSLILKLLSNWPSFLLFFKLLSLLFCCGNIGLKFWKRNKMYQFCNVGRGKKKQKKNSKNTNWFRFRKWGGCNRKNDGMKTITYQYVVANDERDRHNARLTIF